MKVVLGRSTIIIDVDPAKDGAAIESIRREIYCDSIMAYNLITTNVGNQIIVSMFPAEDVSVDDLGRMIRVLMLIQAFLKDSGTPADAQQLDLLPGGPSREIKGDQEQPGC